MGKSEYTHIDLSTVEAILVNHTAKTQQEITKHNTSVLNDHRVSSHCTEKEINYAAMHSFSRQNNALQTVRKGKK